MSGGCDDLAVDAALWWRGLRETNNVCFLPLFFDKSRYLVLCGGGGSGKSIFAGRKVLERCVSEPGHRFLVCRKVGRTLWESCYRQLIGQATAFYRAEIRQIYRGEMRIAFKNGSEVLFTGLDDVEKLKSIYGITGVWIEEASELSEADFNQLDIRLRGETAHYKQILVTFNPISILHWLKRRFFDGNSGECPLGITTHRSNYKDNRFLPAEDAAVLEALRETDEYYYTVYCLGEWGVLGKSVFDAQAVTARLLEKVVPIQTGWFETGALGAGLLRAARNDGDGGWIDDDVHGFIKIYEEPQAGAPYVIGADTAGDGSDKFVAQVLDNRDGRQVATLIQQTDEDLFAKQLYALGMYYNTALIGVETNFSTYPVMELERLRYPKQYVRESVDTFTHKVKTSFGFRTDSKTRPLAIAELIKAAREDIALVSDKETLEEMLTFVRNEAFRPEAESGAHDDCVMALAIAHYIRPQQGYLQETPRGERVRWTEDQWEDYRNADKDGRAYLMKKWVTGTHPGR